MISFIVMAMINQLAEFLKHLTTSIQMSSSTAACVGLGKAGGKGEMKGHN